MVSYRSIISPFQKRFFQRSAPGDLVKRLLKVYMVDTVHGGHGGRGGHGGHEKHSEHVQHVESAAAHLLPDQPKVEDGVGDKVKEARLVNEAIRDLLLRSGQQVSSINHGSTVCIELSLV